MLSEGHMSSELRLERASQCDTMGPDQKWHNKTFHGIVPGDNRVVVGFLQMMKAPILWALLHQT